MKENLLNREEYLKDVGDLIVAKILFGKKDSDLVAWVQSIPRGKFSSIIKDAVLAYINNDTTYKLPVFEPEKNAKPTIAKSLSIGKGDYDIYTYLYSIDKYLRSSKIKEILRHYMSDAAPKLTAPKIVPDGEKQKISMQNSKSAKKDSRSKKNKNKLLKFAQLMNEGKY